ncbi:ferredoxin [Clostridium algifaecis]|uniref:Ferredoxin n=1 Tax=Clostridium algifaecis TaxID=1472040 RepID=A0ABS4KVM6_9CLOT|nr:EFR1 family ferrodoxin [Clostridium algifaecis]MBP2034062.1 ferredoxin [Clostridium algifaecis]
MKGVLYYFSGTGNTKWVADKFESIFKDHNIDLKLINVEDKEKVKSECLKKNDFIIVGSPVHTGFLPKIVCNFLDDVKFQNRNTKAIVYSTQGGKSSPIPLFMGKCLKKKGYKIVAQSSIEMPNNYYFSIGRKPDKHSIEKLLASAEKKTKYIVENFINNNVIIESKSEMKVLFGKILFNIFKKSMPKLSKNISSTEQCNKCGMCLINCPQNNITFENGHAVFHSKCILCMRCIHICPVNAITYKNEKIIQTQKYIIDSLKLKK